MAWQPEQEALGQLSNCLKNSLSGHNKAAQKEAEIILAQAKSSPGINNYLTYLFSNPVPPQGLSYTAEEYHAVRSAAAIMLKNNIRTDYKAIPEDSLALIRSSITLGLQDKNPQIRSFAGTVITEIIKTGGIHGWPGILPELINLVSNTSGNVTQETQEGAMAALAKVCEDNKKLLDRDYQGQRPLSVLIPKLIDFTKSPNTKVRTLALTSLNVFIPHKSQALLVNLDRLLLSLFELADDPSPDVRRQICRAFVQIVEIRPDKIQPHIKDLVDYIIAQQRKVDEEELACDAAEFWLSVGEHNALWKSLEPYLNKIIPVLLDSMVYSEDDIAMLEGGDDDFDKEDRAEDIKPAFAKVKGARTAMNGETDLSQNGAAYEKLNSFEDDDLDEGEIEESDDEDDEDGNPEDRWNLRKCSAAALDVFANDFKGLIFKEILPYLMTNLKHEDWPHREAAVLALGAVAEGCMDDVTPHLPELVPYLISLLNDTEPLVRQITCWTLGRYSAWGANLEDPSRRSLYFEPMMDGILRKMLDRNKRVQEAGASAFAHLEEKAGKQLIPYCDPIIRQFVQCFERYKDRNMFILYDCVQTLAEYVGPELARPDLVNLLMPALIKRWSKVSDQSRELFPLLECLSYVATAFGRVFTAFAPPIFNRCINIITQNLDDYHHATGSPILDTPDTDFLVTSLDLLSAIIQIGNEEESAKLVNSTTPGLFELLTLCMQHSTNDVRQSSYALLGDCAKYVFPRLQPSLPIIMPILMKQLDLSTAMDEQIHYGFSVVNNACWSVGEIAMQHGKGMAPYIPELFRRILDIIGNPEVPQSVNENAGIALGRLGLENSEMLAPQLATFSAQFLGSMETVEYTEEKATAFAGFTLIVGHNPQAMEKDLLKFFRAIALYAYNINFYQTHYHLYLRSLFSQTLNAYKSLIPDFNGFLAQLSPEEQESLRTGYDMNP